MCVGIFTQRFTQHVLQHPFSQHIQEDWCNTRRNEAKPAHRLELSSTRPSYSYDEQHFHMAAIAGGIVDVKISKLALA